jgi:hypothetical protein
MENEAARASDSLRDYWKQDSQWREDELRRQKLRESVRDRWRGYRRGWQPNWRDVLVNVGAMT